MCDMVVAIHRGDGEQVEVKIEMPNVVYDRFTQIARRRNCSVTEIFGEALRLAQLLDEAQRASDKSLLFRQGNNYLELESV